MEDVSQSLQEASCDGWEKDELGLFDHLIYIYISLNIFMNTSSDVGAGFALGSLALYYFRIFLWTHQGDVKRPPKRFCIRSPVCMGLFFSNFLSLEPTVFEAW